MEHSLSLDQIRGWLKIHQRRLRAGDELPFMTDVAKRAGVHRDTIYALLNNEHINERSQYALTRVMREIDTEYAGKTKTRLMSISLGQHGPTLSIGLQQTPILRNW